MREQGLEPFKKIFDLLMLVLYLPMLFCVMFIGNKMDYFDDVKADILIPNAVLTVIALILFAICLLLVRLGKRITWTKRLSRLTDLALIVLSAVFFLVSLAISRETVFDMSVDQGIVRDAAKDVAHCIPLGYRFEFSIDHNNIPITYILGKVYGLAESWFWFRHDPEYMGVIVGCAIVTAAGFFCCELVKKLTKNPLAVLVCYILYFATAGLCPWKGVPYTDSYGILFPVLCFWLYLLYRECGRVPCRVFFLFLAFLAGAVGGLIKPSAFIAGLAVLGLEGATWLAALVKWIRSRGKRPEDGEASPEDRAASSEDRMESPEDRAASPEDRMVSPEDRMVSPAKHMKTTGIYLLLAVLFFGITYVGSDLFKKNYIIDDIGLIYNEELESNLQYYFFSSANETTTGSFAIEDYSVFGEFQFSKADRNAACMERAWERIRGRGFFGTIYFSLKKLVKSFNDGSFAWTDVRYNKPFPEDLTSDGMFAEYLRSLFVPGGDNQGKYDTFAIMIWILVLVGVPGIVLAPKEKSFYSVFTILLIGILVYLILFESGARYVYIFLPVFIAMSVCGMGFLEAAVPRGKRGN